jgi:hypothetical protein
MAKVKAVFYLPLEDNDGRDLSIEADILETELYLHFVGWTRLGLVQGAYRMESGVPAIDVHRAYAVILDNSRLPELEEILTSFKRKTLQEAIYLEIQWNVDVRFI